MSFFSIFFPGVTSDEGKQVAESFFVGILKSAIQSWQPHGFLGLVAEALRQHSSEQQDAQAVAAAQGAVERLK